VGLVDQLLGVNFTPWAYFLFLYQIGAQSWPFVVLNSLAKAKRNEVITFLIPDIHQISFVDTPVLTQQPTASQWLIGHHNSHGGQWIYPFEIRLNPLRTRYRHQK
jgi:hypothetical protein